MDIRVWDGKEWERYCMGLLRLHHGAHELHEVPDRHGGDLGLEAYASNGCAYQCYAALEPLSTSELYENQRDKLTVDLTKLKNKKADVARLLGSIVIRRYMFMIHRHDSHKLVQHANTKAAEVKAWGLTFVADDFEIVVITDDAFPRERASILGLREVLMDVPLSPVDDLGTWTSENQGLVATVNRKLTALPLSPQRREKYIEQLLQQYLNGENVLSRIREKYPDQWQAAVRCKGSKENRLVLEHGELLDSPSTGQLTKLARELTDDLRSAVPPMDIEVAKSLAWHSLADWLIRCPLDFPTEGTAA
jgi:hypothetical protein